MPTVTLTWTNLGIDRNTRLVLNKGMVLGDLFGALWVNNGVAPSVTSVLADLVECTDAAYSEIDLVGSSWTGSTIAGVATYVYPTVTFFFSGSPGPQTIYGFFLKDASGHLSALALLSAPYIIPGSGGSITFDVVDNGQQC